MISYDKKIYFVVIFNSFFRDLQHFRQTLGVLFYTDNFNMAIS